MANFSFSTPHKIRKVKLVFLGEQSVGKTSLITRFMYDTFDNTYQATVGIDFLSKTVHLQEKAVRFQLWDTAGQERFRSLIPSYIRDSNVAIVVYDVTNSSSFEQTTKWIQDVRMERGENVVVVLVGNKIDLHHSRQVTHDAGKFKAEKFGSIFMETSAKNGYNVRYVFQKIAESLPDLTDERKYLQFKDIVLENKLEDSDSIRTNKCAC